MNMPLPPQPGQDPEGTATAQVGITDTPFGQRVALIITILVGKDAALQLADAITKTGTQLSSTRLVIPTGNGTNAVGQDPG